jgi:hypothetical protein
MHKVRTSLFIFVLLFASLQLTFGEEIKKPVPYKEDEFPQWLKDLRRAEIVFFGTLPFTLLVSMQGYEIARFYIHDQDPLYTPWPFRSAQAPPYTFEEQMTVVGTALVISGLLALADYILGKINHREEEAIRRPM